LTKRDDSGVDIPSASRDSTKKATRRRGLEVPGAIVLTLKEVGYPFRLRGDPKPDRLEIDNDELFIDYAREQWMGSIVSTGMYLFDRYVMPDFAFQVVQVEPEDSIVTKSTQIRLQPAADLTERTRGTTSLDDVIGHESVKRKCMLVLKYLSDPKRFGEWAPRAILFYGSPGTGKTMTARALADQANAKILLAKASDLIGVHVGDGGRRISALFEDARQSAPSIVFIDELDAIGLARSFQSIRGDVSEVVTALLAEMDRTTEDLGVVVIGATNAPVLIDPALRSRFDTIFEFGLPTFEERVRILQLYVGRLPIPFEMDLQKLAARTDGLSGRDLRDRILKESLHTAIAEEKQSITEEIVIGVLKGLKVDQTPSYTV